MKLSRGSFIRKAALAGSALIFSKGGRLYAQNSPQGTAPPPLSAKILANTAIILGGGLAGLYSAYLLKKKGVRVRIVEASPRLGGRVLSFTDPTNGYTGDLGGEWIGENQSIIRSLAQELDLKLASPNWNQIRALWDSNRLSEKSRTNLEKLVSLQSKIPPNQIEGLDKISLYRYLRYQGFSEGELEDMDRVVKAFYGESSRNLSSHFLLEAIDSKKSFFQNLVRFETGAESLVKKLAQNLTPDEIITSDPAVRVSQTPGGIQIELASGMVLRSKHLICTLPTYAVSDIQWNPGLPREKIFALLRIGYGRIRKELVHCDLAPISPQEGSGIVDWVFPTGTSLVSTISAEGRATALDRSTSDVSRELLTRSIQTYQPSAVSSLSVERNGFGKGSVSLYTPGSYGLKEILESSWEQVHFAGEHLGEVPGTMEAALSSAVRAVRKI